MNEIRSPFKAEVGEGTALLELEENKWEEGLISNEVEKEDLDLGIVDENENSEELWETYEEEKSNQVNKELTLSTKNEKYENKSTKEEKININENDVNNKKNTTSLNDNDFKEDEVNYKNIEKEKEKIVNPNKNIRIETKLNHGDKVSIVKIIETKTEIKEVEKEGINNKEISLTLIDEENNVEIKIDVFPFLFGRNQKNANFYPEGENKDISRKHFVLHLREAKYEKTKYKVYIEDQKSSNGTFLKCDNDFFRLPAYQEMELKEGNVIAAGKKRYRVKLEYVKKEE